MPARHAVNHWHFPGTSLHAPSREPIPPLRDLSAALPAPVMASASQPPTTAARSEPQHAWVCISSPRRRCSRTHCPQAGSPSLPASPTAADHHVCPGSHCAAGARGAEARHTKGMFPSQSLLRSLGPGPEGSRPHWSQQPSQGPLASLPGLCPQPVLSPFLGLLRSPVRRQLCRVLPCFLEPELRVRPPVGKRDSATPPLPSQRCRREKKLIRKATVSLGCGGKEPCSRGGPRQGRPCGEGGALPEARTVRPFVSAALLLPERTASALFIFH